jgi:membrane peptidoglycan carboxypeptidase
MGYDNNQPLTGVTGAGLPAEIWRETMLRVHEGLPARPLPMWHPSAREADGPSQAPAPEPQAGRRDDGDIAERILLDVIGNIFGGQRN